MPDPLSIQPHRLTMAADAIMLTIDDENPRPDLIGAGFGLREIAEARKFLIRLGIIKPSSMLKGGLDK